MRHGVIWREPATPMEEKMPFESFEEILQYAIEKEKEAADFYEEASSQESFSGSKEMLLQFAYWEARARWHLYKVHGIWARFE